MTIRLLFTCFFLPTLLFKFSRQFSEETIKFAVSEDAPINTIIGRLEEGQPALSKNYRLSRGNSKIRFDDQSLEFSISSPLDRESENIIDMLIITTPPSIIHVLIDILDVNDNPPKFPVDTQKIEIPETAPIGWRVSIAGATDPDAGKNGTIGGYQLTETFSQDATTPFSIVQEADGFVFVEVMGKLDREQRDVYSMRLTAKDQGTPELSSSCLLNIFILDTNDNPPNFGTRSIRLDWNGQPSATLFHLNATDADSGDNARLTYRILAPANEFFSISNDTALVTRDNTLDACSPHCEFVVEARDGGVPPLMNTLNVQVRVEYGNKHEPNINIRFYPAEFPFIVVQSDDVNGKTLAILSITDADGPLGDNSSIWIDSGNNDSIFSLISRQSIHILALKNVEKAREEQYTLQFAANDGQKPVEKTSRKELKVFFKRYVKSTVVDVASEFNVEVEKDIVPGSFVAHVATNCSDLCAFELQTSDLFHIDPTNGIIVTASELPDDVDSYHLPVKIHLPPPSTEVLDTDVFVKVIKESAPKSLIRSNHSLVHLKRAYTFATWHNVTVGTIVGRLPKAQIYTTIDTKSELGIFPDGSIFVGRQITGDYVTLPVILQDRNTTQKCLVTVIVKHGNENSPTCDVTEIHVREDVPIGAVIGRLHAKDADPGAAGVVSYRLMYSDVIHVDPSSGNIRSLRKFDAEHQRNFTFTYEVKDYGTPRKTANCTGRIMIEDINDNYPKFTSSYYSAKISGTHNTTVVIVHADDEDVEEQHKRVKYRLLNLHDYFQIDQNSGKIRTSQDIPKTWNRLNLTVEAYNVDSDDIPTLSIKSFVLITVVNSSKVIMMLKSEPIVRIYQNDLPGVKVGKLEVASSDSLVWVIQDPRFSIISDGTIILKKRTRSTAKFNVVIRTSSGTEKKFEHRVEFVNSDRNDSVPEVLNVVVKENQTHVLDLPDKNWEISKVVFVSEGNDTDNFHIQGKTLYRSNELDTGVEAFICLKSISGDFKVIHLTPTSSPTPSESIDCLSFVHLIIPPATVSLNCSNSNDVTLQNQNLSQLQVHEGSLLIPSQSELINHVDLVATKKEMSKPFMITLIKDQPTEEVKFASNNVLMLLSSVHNIGASFGRVTAESAYRIRYYLVGTSQISIDADTGELFLKERFFRNLNDIQIIAVIPTGIAKAKVTIEVIEDRLQLFQSNFVLFAPISSRANSDSFSLGKIQIGRDDVMVDVIDDRFYARKSEIFAKKHFVPHSNFYDLEGIVKKGKLSAQINVTIFFGKNSEDVADIKENELLLEVEENSPVGTVVGVVPNSKYSKYRLVDPSCGLLIDQDGVIRTTTLFDREKVSLLKTKMIEPAANRIWDVLVLIGDVNDNKPKTVNAPGTIVLSNDMAQYEKGHVVYKLFWEDSDDIATDVNFAIVDGDPFGHLEILDSGDIILKSIPTESFNATIRIYDNRPPFPVNSDDVTIEFQVSPKKTLNCDDSEFWIIGKSPQKYDAIGKMTQSTFEKVTWRIIPQSLPRAEFVINPMTGEIQMNSESRLKNGEVFNLKIQIISYDAETSGFCRATIHVDELTPSENIKLFDNGTLEFYVSETTDRGIAIGKIDLIDATDVVFRIWNDFNFTISPFDGTIFTNSPLDYEDVKVYNIRVMVDRPGSSGIYIDVVVHVTDENDETPRFITGDVVNLRVREEEETLSYPLVIGSSIAEDSDEGQNGLVTYSILFGNTSLFAVNSTTGDIISLGPLDREESDLYELVIEAKDAGIPSLSATSRILIHVDDINDNAPQFTQSSYFVKIPENQPSGSQVLRVVATDRDLNPVLLYHFLDAETETLPFRVDVASGWITVAGKVDREETEKYEITVMVTDGKTNRTSNTTCLVTILIEDVNDNPPVIENQNLDIFVRADVAEGDLLYVIDAHDADQQDRNLTFFLNGTDADLFTVTDHGEIILAKRGGLTTKSYFSIEATVIDGVGHATSSDYTFYLHTSQDFPVWKEKMASTSVREHEALELAVFKAKGQGVRYSIVSRCKEHLSIESMSGVLSAKNTLDHEDFSECPVFVIATKFLDNKPLSTITKILIKIVDINDNSPIFDQQLYHFNITENSGPERIGQVHASDADSGDNAKLYYEIVGGDKNHEFMITENGEIETIRDLDRETQAEYRLIVEAIDGGKPRRRGNTTVIVKVLDEDDNAPRFSRIFHVEIAEDVAIGEFVIQLSASDADESVNHRFALEGDNIPFRVEEETGRVFVNDTLDYEKKPSYRIKVRLTDGVWLIETSLFVNLKDVNDNAPIFKQSEYFFISENNKSIIGTVLATDLDSDENGKVRYSITSPFFRIDPTSGQITRLRPLPNPVTSLKVIASDHGVPRLQSHAIIYVAEFGAVRKEFIRQTAKEGDVIGTGFTKDSEVFPREIAKVSADGRHLVLEKTNKSNDGLFWILENSTITEYRFVQDNEGNDTNTDTNLNNTVHVTINPLHPFMSINVTGCSHFEPLPSNSEFHIDKNGKLYSKSSETATSTFNLSCNDGIWPRRNQNVKLVVQIDTIQDKVEFIKPLEQKKTEKRLPKSLQLKILPEFSHGTIVWQNTDKIPLSIANDSILEKKNGNLLLKTSLFSPSSFDVFGPGFRRTSVSIVPGDCAAVFNEEHLFVETSGNSSEIFNFGWSSEAIKECGIQILPDHLTELFHVNGSKLIALQRLPPGTFQLHLTVGFSQCHVVVIVPLPTRSDVSPHLPSVIFFRENFTSSPHHPLLRLPNAYTLSEDSSFLATDSGAVWSRNTLNSSSRSVYRIGVKHETKQEVLRVLLDDVISNSDIQETRENLEYRVVGNLKKIHDLEIVPFATCLPNPPKTSEDFKITRNCHVITAGGYSNLAFPMKISTNKTLNVSVINEPSEDVKLQQNAIVIEFFGKESAISNLIIDLKRIYSDMKIHCLAVWQHSEDLKYLATFALIDRNDVIIDAAEAQRTLTSFLEKQRPSYIDVIGFRTDQCDGVTCTQNGATCQTSLQGGPTKRVVSRSEHIVFDLPMKKLIGRCECSDKTICEPEEFRKQHDDVMEENMERTSCDEMDCGKNGECVMEEDGVPICRCREGNSAFESLSECGKATDVFSIPSGGHFDISVRNESLLKCDVGCEGVQQLEMDFRTLVLKSKLFEVQFEKQRANIEIIDGTVSFSISDDYTRPIETRIAKFVSDGRWHRLRFQMSENGKKIAVQIDGRGKEVKSRVALPMLFTAPNIRIITPSESCFRRLLVQNQWINPLVTNNRIFNVFSTKPVLQTCSSRDVPQGFLSNFSDTTTIILLSILAIICVIAVAVCILAIRRRCRMSSGEKTDRGGWKRATEINAFAVNHRGHVNRSMVKSPEDDTYDVATICGVPQLQLKSTSTDDAYTTRRYRPAIHQRRDGHINMAYL